MPAPTTYTEAQLKAYANTVLGSMAATLGWTVGAGSYDEVINEVLIDLNISDISAQAGLGSVNILRAVTRRETWKAVVGALADRFNFEADLQRFDRSQMQKMAIEALHRADADCQQLGIGFDRAIKVFSINHTDDPYMPFDDSLTDEFTGFDED